MIDESNPQASKVLHDFDCNFTPCECSPNAPRTDPELQKVSRSLTNRWMAMLGHTQEQQEDAWRTVMFPDHHIDKWGCKHMPDGTWRCRAGRHPIADQFDTVSRIVSWVLLSPELAAREEHIRFQATNN